MYHPKMTLLEKVLIQRQTNTLKKHWGCRKKLPISLEELKFEEMIPRETLEKMFKDAERLLNVRDGVTTAASNDDRIRTVKNINSSYPLIVTPNKKNRNILEV